MDHQWSTSVQEAHVDASQDGELEEWLDRQRIQDLIHRYSDSVTRADYEQTATVFAPDAVWEETQSGTRFQTAREFLDYLIEGGASLDLLIQTPHSPVVELLGEGRARATTTIHEIVRGVATADSGVGTIGSEINIDRYGIYYDELAKFGREWRFTRRTFVPFFTATGTVVGDVSGNRSLRRPA
jgi:ketosteroid isomerase-like protein